MENNKEINITLEKKLTRRKSGMSPEELLAVKVFCLTKPYPYVVILFYKGFRVWITQFN